GLLLAATELRSHSSAPIIAVGAIRDYTGSDTAGVAPTVAEMLATNLARLPGLHVLSTARLYELMGPAEARGQESTTMERAARRARATQLVPGRLYRRPREPLRLALAAYYAGNINPVLSGPKSHLAQAMRLAAHASDRERLLIRGAWARETGDPADLAIAETLAIRYPTELDGHYLLGLARIAHGE